MNEAHVCRTLLIHREDMYKPDLGGQGRFKEVSSEEVKAQPWERCL